jgi:hypothetical protein
MVGGKAPIYSEPFFCYIYSDTMSNFTMMGLDVSSATIGLSILSYSDKRKKKAPIKARRIL